MAQTIPVSLLPLMISLCLCFSLLPSLIVAHQTNANDDVFVTNSIEKGACRHALEKEACIDYVTNLIEKACRHSLEKEVCIDSLKLMSNGPKGTEDLTILIERALKVVSNITNETLDRLNDFIKEDTEGESYKQLLFDCTQNYKEAKFNVEIVLPYVYLEEEFDVVDARVYTVNVMVKSCDQKIRNQPGHSQSLLINKNSKMIRRLSNFAVVINRLSEITKYGRY